MVDVNWLPVLLVCVSVYRLTRLVAQDAIFEPVRARLDAWAQSGERALDKHRSPSTLSRVAAWLTEMTGCPWCLSTWLGYGVALAWWAAVDVTDPLLWVPAVALTASAFTGILTLLVGWVERLAED